VGAGWRSASRSGAVCSELGLFVSRFAYAELGPEAVGADIALTGRYFLNTPMTEETLTLFGVKTPKKS